MTSVFARHSSAIALASFVAIASAPPARAVLDFSVSTVGPGAGAKTPLSVAAADLNGDTVLDLVIANKAANSVSVRLGLGDGTFGPAQNYAVGNKPLSVATGDCDGDGDLDIFTANSGPNTVTVLVNNGSGAFTQAPGSPVAAGSTPYFVLASDDQGQPLDLNGDSLLDLAVANRPSDKVTTLQGIGGCQFTALQTNAFGGNAPEGLAAGDFDGVNGVDLAVADRVGNTVTVLLNNGAGIFPSTCPTAACKQFAAGEDPSYVIARDLNADGKLDLVVTSANNGDDVTMKGLSILLGQGTGNFGTPITFGTGGKTPEAVAAGHFNGDAVGDLVVANKAGDNLGSLRGLGGANFQFVAAFALGNAPEAVATGDFDGDGKLDVVAVNSSSNDLSTCLGNGNNGFTCSTAPAPPSGFGTAPRGVAVADLGSAGGSAADGLADFVALFEGSDDLNIFLGDGSGLVFDTLFKPPWSFLPDAKNPHAVATAHFNGNAVVDLAMAVCGGTGTAKDKLVVVLDRNFGAPQLLSAGNCPTAVGVADLNNAGGPDIVVVNSKSNDITIFRNSGTGSFANIGSLPVGSTPMGVAIADFGTSPTVGAKNGILDLAVVNSKSDTVTLFFGSGNLGSAGAAFPTSGTIGLIANSDARAIAAADFNKDDVEDLAVANYNTAGIGLANAVSVRLGFGGVSFDAPVNFATGKTPTAIVAAEVSGDVNGYVDLVVTNRGTNNVSILEGRGGSATLFEAALTLSVGTNPLGIGHGDLDGDLDVDIVVSNSGSDDFTVLTNNSPTCGDGVVEGNEQCDPPGTVFPSCPPTVCGPTCRVE